MAWLIILLPAWVWAQALEFEFQPDAFPASINGVAIGQPWAGGMDALTPTFCDLDNDGDPDLYCGDNRGYISFFENMGSSANPDFQLVTNFFDSLVCYRTDPSPAWGWSKIRFADLDGDGLKDALLSAIGINQLMLYHNQGTAFQPLFCPPADTLRDIGDSMIFGQKSTLADIDADGKLDLFAAYGGYLRYYHNVGTATNPAFELISTNWFNTYTSENIADPCFSDLDSDGDLDLLIGTGEGHVIYYTNEGTAQNPQMILVTSNYLNIAVQKYASPEMADIDGDGDLDLFVGRSSSEGQSPSQGSLFFYRNDGTPQIPDFRFITSNYLLWDSGCYSEPRLGDVDGDGNPDLLSSIGNHLLFYRNTGLPSNPIFNYESSNYGNITVTDLIPWFVDINGDGLLDLMAGTSAIPGPPGLKLFLNQGTAQVPNWVLYSNDLVPGVFTTYSVILCPWTGDIDGDSDQDLFVTDDNGYCYFFRNIGSSTNFQFQYITNNWQNLGTPYFPAFRFGCFYDVDNDNDLDLFMNDEAPYWELFDKNLQFYRNIGTPQNANMVLESSDLLPDQMIWQSAPYVMDMDQDGDGDLFVGDSWGGIRYFKNVTGDTSAVAPPPVERHPRAGLQISLGPNPANPNTVISFSLPFAQQIDLGVYNILGARITTLASGLKIPGNYVIPWDASGNASGVYIIRLETPQSLQSAKLIMVK